MSWLWKAIGNASEISGNGRGGSAVEDYYIGFTTACRIGWFRI